MFAPMLCKYLTTSTWPLRDARCTAVEPRHIPPMFALAPASTRSLTVSRCPPSHAQCSGVLSVESLA
eukprot:29149-Pelagococcus_subviridis.AAC.5